MAEPQVTCEQLPNGYWSATLRIPNYDGEYAYEQTADSFHDEREARDWAEMMVHFLTEDGQS